MTKEKVANYHEILHKVGQFGKFQILSWCLLTWAYVTQPFSTMGYIFWAARPDYWCSVQKPENLNYISDIQWKDMMIPVAEDGHSQCSYYHRNFTTYTQDDFINVTADNFTHAEVKKCDEWEYDTSQYQSTLVTQMDLVCDRFWLRSISQSAFLMGNGIGLLFIGRLADRFGRRRIILIFAPIQALATLILCFTWEIYVFIVLRVIHAFALGGLEVCCYVLLMEIVGERWRVIVSAMHMCTFAAACMVVAGLAYLIRDGFYLQLVLAIPNLFYIVYFWFVNESPLWLVDKKKYDEFNMLITKIAKTNGISLDETDHLNADPELVESEPEAKDKRLPLQKVCLDPYMVLIIIVQAYMWFTTSGIYYGLSFNAVSLGGNDYLDTFISGAVEIPAHLLVILIYTKCGRKMSAFVMFLITSFTIGATAFINKDLVTIILIVTNLGKFAISILFGMIYLYSSELYPTNMRAMGFGISYLFGRMGSMLAPLTLELGEFYPGLPMIAFAVLSFIGALSTLVLPETRGTDLPQTLDDVKHLPMGFECINWCHRKEMYKTTTVSEDISTSKTLIQ